MSWKVQARDTKTVSGHEAKFLKYDGKNWPCPWVFVVNGKSLYYSVEGFLRNHTENKDHPLDLVEPKIAGRTVEEWKTLARRDDCLKKMVPGDLRELVDEIERGARQ